MFKENKIGEFLFTEKRNLSKVNGNGEVKKEALRLQRMKYSDVVYAIKDKDGDKNAVIFITENGEEYFKYSWSLKKVIEANDVFSQINKGMIINRTKIVSVKRNFSSIFAFINGKSKSFAVSPAYRNKLKNDLSRNFNF